MNWIDFTIKFAIVFAIATLAYAIGSGLESVKWIWLSGWAGGTIAGAIFWDCTKCHKVTDRK